MPVIDAMFTIAPLRRSIIGLDTAWLAKNAPVSITSIERRH
jgi:hypothetical protein